MTTYIGSAFTRPATNTTWTNAQYQTWATALKAALDGCGLVQTADTGQANVATITIPALNTWTDYLIYRFNDTEQATTPIFIKIHLGRWANGGTICFRVSCGTGTDGAGALTGAIFSHHMPTAGYTLKTGSYSAYNISCHTEGYFCLFADGATTLTGWNCGHANAIVLFRPRDSAGAIESGKLCLWSPVDISTSCLGAYTDVTGTMVSRGFTSSYCIVPGEPSSTVNSAGDKQLYPHFYNDPDIKQSWATFTVRGSEFGAALSTFTATPVGATARTFATFGSATPSSANVRHATAFVPAFLWE